MLYDSELGSWGDVDIPTSVINEIRSTCRNLGRLWKEDGKAMYHINKYMSPDGVYCYRPVEFLMTETRDNPPEDIHGCFDQDAVAIWYDVKAADKAFAKWSSVLWFCGITRFVLFIWGSSMLK